MILGLSSAALAEVWVPFDSPDPTPPTFEVIVDNEDSTVISGNIHGMYVDTISIDGESFLSFRLYDSEIPGAQAAERGEIGYPAVISCIIWVQIPNDRDFQATIAEIDTLSLDFIGYPLIATYEPQLETQQQHPDVYMKPEIYEQDDFWPPSIFEVDSSQPEIMRSTKFVLIRVNFPYNPVSRTVRSPTQFKIRLRYQGTGSNPWADKAISYSFDQLFRASFINYKSEDQEVLDFSPGILIVTTPECADSAVALQDHYLSMGHPTYVETVSSVPDTAEVRNLVVQYFQDLGIEAAILFGDIPLYEHPKFCWNSYDFYTASYYGRMDDDRWEDILVTLLPVAEGVRNIKRYQKEPPSGGWAKRVLQVAHKDTSYGRRYHWPKVQIKNFCLDGYEVIDAFGLFGPILDSIVEAIDVLGVQWLNYRGHGNGCGWREVGPDGSFMIEDIKDIDPNSAPLVLLNICCREGALQCPDTVSTEQWLKGPVALTTAATMVSYREENDFLDKTIFLGLFWDPVRIDDWVAAILYARHMSIARDPVDFSCWLPDYHYPSYWENAWFYVTFGGPYTNIWREMPITSLTAFSYPDTIWPRLEDSTEVAVYLHGGPLPNARVVLYSKDGDIFSRGVSDFSGSCQLNFFPQCWEGEADLWVYADNCVPFHTTIPIALQSHLKGLGIEREGGGKIRLNWQGVPQSLVERYVIFRSDEPIFEPSSQDSFACTQDTTIVLTDLPDHNCFLVVARMPDDYCDDLVSTDKIACFKRHLQYWK